jgi:hypothetical protein
MTPSSHVRKGLGFHPGISCCKNMVTLNGALNKESNAPRAPPPLPPTVEAYSRNFTIPAARSRLKTVEAYARNFTIPTAHSRLKTVARCNHDASTRKSPTSPETPPRHHQQAPKSPRPHHQGGAGPASPSKRSTNILPKSCCPHAPAGHGQPQPARAGHS